jgi:hypothetical protein
MPALSVSFAEARPRGLDWAGLTDGRQSLDLNRATAAPSSTSFQAFGCAAIAARRSIAIEVATGAA